MLQVPRKMPAQDFSERVAREKPEGLIAAEQQLRAAREARAEHAEKLQKVVNQHHDLDVNRSNNGVTALSLERLRDEIANLQKKSPDFESAVGAARRILESEREAFAPIFDRIADDAARDVLKRVDDAIATLEAVVPSLASIEREATAIGRATRYGPHRANRILRDIRELAKALADA